MTLVPQLQEKNEYLSKNLILHEKKSVQLKTDSNFLFK